MSTPISPFQISIPDAQIDRLKQKLALTTWPDELEDAGWDYGAPLQDVQRLAAYWKDGFDWKRQEEKLNNELAHFRTAVEVDSFGPLDIHFVHQQSEELQSTAIPLLFIHGWPGSFLECSKLLPLLMTHREGSSDSSAPPAFHVVAPSLPNFGFSQGVKKRGFGLGQYAEVCHKLMLKLGYDEYVIQGGDWGGPISTVIRARYPSACKASHVNMALVGPPSFLETPLLAVQHAVTPYSESEKRGLERMQYMQNEGMGYMKEQATKPQTLGYALSDSPVGLLAWIYEKLHDWTDDYPWTDDEILTWISIYWFSTAGCAASLRIYYETQHDPTLNFSALSSVSTPTVPIGVTYMPKELVLPPKSWARGLGPIVFESEHAEGGHFAAWEKPELLAGDVQKMFGKQGGGAYAVIRGRDGYVGGNPA
ncbi:MAG: hypothetical protein M1837_002450 [Sclerophora amabilis]|nr:MAG: hypothetical protein M1837_002450 [Sclerophora amabilis]